MYFSSVIHTLVMHAPTLLLPTFQQKLEKSRLLDDDRLREQQRLAALQMSTLKSVASGGDAAASAKGKQL